jgi:hypothetical protein
MFNSVRKKFSQPLFYIFPLLIFLTTSCGIFGNGGKPIEEVKCDLPSFANLNTNQDKLDISVNVDGSGSMIGYVATNNSNYTQVLDAIESVIAPNTNTTVEYKRIGNSNPISRNDFRRDAKKVGFYDGSDSKYPKVSSPIQEAIQPLPQGKDKLTVIITDLEGDDGDLISEKLEKYYFNQTIRDQGYTVGVWAVKTQFKGNIYDPNTGEPKLYYDTEGKDVENHRPFYVLFIGKYAQIANYFDQIKNLNSQLITNSESQMFIFPASNIVREAINLGSLQTREQNIKLPKNNQLERLLALEDDNIVVQTANDNISYEFFEIVHQGEKNIKLNYKLPFPLLTEKDTGGVYSLKIDQNNLKLQTKVFTFTQNQSNSSSNLIIQSAQANEAEKADTETENKPLENESLNNNKSSENKPSVNENQTLSQPQIKNHFRENNNVSLQNGLTIEDVQWAYLEVGGGLYRNGKKTVKAIVNPG